jgi:pimeloyl-ACP methyl ester carboxylesterase
VLKSYMQFIWGQPGTLKPEHLAVYEEALAAEGFNEGMLEALRAISAFRLNPAAFATARYPRHVLWGSKDPLVSVVQGERLALAIGADLRVLDGVGHCVPEERPDAVAEAIAG